MQGGDMKHREQSPPPYHVSAADLIFGMPSFPASYCGSDCACIYSCYLTHFGSSSWTLHPWWWRWCVPSKRWEPHNQQRIVTFQDTGILIYTAVKTLKLHVLETFCSSTLTFPYPWWTYGYTLSWVTLVLTIFITNTVIRKTYHHSTECCQLGWCLGLGCCKICLDSTSVVMSTCKL
jgi:hypothetical protein